MVLANVQAWQSAKSRKAAISRLCSFTFQRLQDLGSLDAKSASTIRARQLDHLAREGVRSKGEGTERIGVGILRS